MHAVVVASDEQDPGGAAEEDENLPSTAHIRCQVGQMVGRSNS